MNGMHSELHWAATAGYYTSSHDYELPPTSTLAQITLCDFLEYGNVTDRRRVAELGS